MPPILTYPGVYIVEKPSGVHTITGVATSITAFVGYTATGRDNLARQVFSFADFERLFGGLAPDSELSYAVQQFFANGGSNAYVVRVPRHGASPAGTLLGSGNATALQVNALTSGDGGVGILVDVDYAGVPASDAQAFNLTVTDPAGNTETFPGVTTDSNKTNYVLNVVNDEDNGSRLVRVALPQGATGRPPQTGTVGGGLTFTDGKLQGLDPTKAYALKMTITIPAVPAAGNTPATPAKTVAVNVPLFDVGDNAPGSVAGFCGLLERKANLALAAKLPGAGVRCVPGNTGGIRVIASVPKWPDATVTFAAPDAPPAASGGAAPAAPSDAAALLALNNATVNVAQFAVGNARQGNLPGSNGSGLPQTGDLIGDPAKFTGIYALDKVDLFNILCIPDATRAATADPKTLDSVDPNSVFTAAMDYCKSRRAFLLVDPPPSVADVSSAVDWKTAGLKVHDTNGAAYFPRLRLPDPLNGFQLRTFAPAA
jgi:hypothetical protein